MTLSKLTKTLALVVVIATASLPSRTAEAVSVADIVSGLKKAYDAYQKYRGGQYTLEQATSDMLDAIDEAKDEILAHIDAIAAADAHACARGVIINAEHMASADESVRQQLAFDSVYCLSLIEAYLATVNDEAAVDTLGFALNALGPVVKMAYAQAGFPDDPDITDLLVNGNLAVIAKLYPHCVVTALDGDSDGGFVEQTIRCTAYNGDMGFGFSWVGDPDLESKKEKAADMATRNTSRAVAQELLPVITAPPPQRPLRERPDMRIWAL
jgi:hypothetical protein